MKNLRPAGFFIFWMLFRKIRLLLSVQIISQNFQAFSNSKVSKLRQFDINHILYLSNGTELMIFVTVLGQKCSWLIRFLKNAFLWDLYFFRINFKSFSAHCTWFETSQCRSFDYFRHACGFCLWRLCFNCKCQKNFYFFRKSWSWKITGFSSVSKV